MTAPHSSGPGATDRARERIEPTLIVARASNGVIGNANALPWHLPEDLAHFRRVTMGHPIIMGRLTWESIGRVLPGRQMIVVTSGDAPLPDEVWRARSLDDALDRAAAMPDSPTPFVIGGARLFAEALPRARRLLLTHVHAAPEGDVHFPLPDPADWTEVARQDGTSQTGLSYSIVDLRRRESPAR